MDARWKKYVILHVNLLLIAAGFAAYALLTRFLLPDGFFHCFLHDVLHLYCPFCGGTRAFLALLTGNFATALHLNGALLLAAFVCLGIDLRAFILLCRKSKRPLLPSRLGQLAIVYFLIWTLLRNTVLFYGFDSAGDLAVYWQWMAPWRKALFLPVGTLMGVALLGVLDCFPLGRRLPHVKQYAAFAVGYLLVALLCILYVYAARYLYLLLLPLTVGLIVYIRWQRKHSCGSKAGNNPVPPP